MASQKSSPVRLVASSASSRVAYNLSALTILLISLLVVLRGRTEDLLRGHCQAALDARQLDPTAAEVILPLLTALDATSAEDAHENAKLLLDGWGRADVAWLLRRSLEERSLPGVRLAASGGALARVEISAVRTMLSDVLAWCAPRSLRFRLQDFLIGRGSRIVALRHGNETLQAALVDELVERVPYLKRRGARRLHGLLRAQLEAVEDESLALEQVESAFQDGLAVSLCSPFLAALLTESATEARPHGGLDAAHVAATFASMAGGIPILELLVRAGFALDRKGKSGAFGRCLSCPACCLHDGITPTGNQAMPFSAQVSSADRHGSSALIDTARH